MRQRAKSINLLLSRLQKALPKETRRGFNYYSSDDAIIEGFTDDIGGLMYNQRLSEKRAFSITQYLKQCGLESEDSIGKGVFPIDRIQSDISKQNKRKLSRKVTIRLIIKV